MLRGLREFLFLERYSVVFVILVGVTIGLISRKCGV